MKRFAFIILVLLALTAPSGAYLAEIGLNPLRLETSARPLGLGGTFVGLADDVSAALYNPGGLAWVKGIALTARDFDNATAVQAYPTGYNSSLGLAVVSAKVSNVPISGGVANSNSNVVLLGYGTKLNYLPYLSNYEIFQHLGFGLSLKSLLGETLRRTGEKDRTANGWDMDMGILWKGAEWWSAGAALQNFLPAGALGGGQIKWDVGASEGIPASLNIGGAAKVIGDIGAPYFLEGRELTIGGEADLTRSGLQLRLGGEWVVNRIYFFRAGLLPALSLGLGYRTSEWGADLASSQSPQTGENQIYFSVLYFPKDWIVLKQLDVDRPAVILETALEKISIEDNRATYDDKIEVAGKVKAGVEVYVNDLRASTADDSSFKVVVPLQTGKNLIIVEARYQGEKKAWKYKVLKKARVEIAEEKEIARAKAKAITPEEKEVVTKQAQDLAEKKRKVEELVTLGVVEVTPGADFKLDASLTRGELAAWIAKASGFRLPKVEGDLYADVKKDNPLAPFIKLVVDIDLLKPFPDGTFRPDAPVTKEEGDKIFKLFRKASR